MRIIGANIQRTIIVLTIQAHQRLLDALLGNAWERILGGAQCPLLAVPASWLGEVDTPMSLTAHLAKCQAHHKVEVGVKDLGE